MSPQYFCFGCGLHCVPFGASEQLEALFGDTPKEGWPCPRCNHPLRRYEDQLAEGIFPQHTVELEAEELYAAFLGQGLPEETAISEESIKAALSLPIKSVDVSPVKGTTRMVLRSITFENNTAIFLGAGPLGAVVYRIRPPFSYLGRFTP